jgi:hypothetical protein
MVVEQADERVLHPTGRVLFGKHLRVIEFDSIEQSIGFDIRFQRIRQHVSGFSQL